MLRKRTSTTDGQRVIRYQECPAKTFTNPDGRVSAGRPVLNHCQIVGRVAKELILRYPTPLRDHLFPLNAPLIAATHDIGKVSPCFYEKIRKACAPCDGSLTALSHINPDLELHQHVCIA